jgi:hypothetical protein
MNSNGDRITAPGLRDNDWAHTPYDDMLFATGARAIGNREPGSQLRGVDDDVDDARTYDDPPRARGRGERRRGERMQPLIAADAIANGHIDTAAGERLGKLTALMIDVGSGRIAYAVMSTGGIGGVGETLYAIPWRALRFDADRNAFRLEAAIDKAPAFDRDHWPSMDDERWAREIHAYYRVTPYWE